MSEHIYGNKKAISTAVYGHTYLSKQHARRHPSQGHPAINLALHSLIVIRLGFGVGAVDVTYRIFQGVTVTLVRKLGYRILLLSIVQAMWWQLIISTAKNYCLNWGLAVF